MTSPERSPLTAPSQHARKRAASPRGNRWLRPIPWFCQRATVGRRSSHATDEAISALSWYRCDMRSRGFRHKYQNLASCYFDKVLLKQKVRMSFLMCFMFYQHQIRKKEKKKGIFFFFFLRSDAFCAIFLMLQTLCLKIRISVQNYEFLAFWILISAFKGWQLWLWHTVCWSLKWITCIIINGPRCIKLTINGNFAFNSNYHGIFDADWLWCLVAMVVTIESKVIINGKFYATGVLTGKKERI